MWPNSLYCIEWLPQQRIKAPNVDRAMVRSSHSRVRPRSVHLHEGLRVQTTRALMVKNEAVPAFLF